MTLVERVTEWPKQWLREGREQRRGSWRRPLPGAANVHWRESVFGRSADFALTPAGWRHRVVAQWQS